MNVSNYSLGVSFGCGLCDYIARGEKGMRLLWKYSHGDKERISKPSHYCEDCQMEIKNVKKHMVFYHRRKR